MIQVVASSNKRPLGRSEQEEIDTTYLLENELDLISWQDLQSLLPPMWCKT
jgi:hypothetical protein